MVRRSLFYPVFPQRRSTEADPMTFRIGILFKTVMCARLYHFWCILKKLFWSLLEIWRMPISLDTIVANSAQLTWRSSSRVTAYKEEYSMHPITTLLIWLYSRVSLSSLSNLLRETDFSIVRRQVKFYEPNWTMYLID